MRAACLPAHRDAVTSSLRAPCRSTCTKIMRIRPRLRCMQRDSNGPETNGLTEAAKTVAACIEIVQQRELDQLIDFVPDEVVDSVIEHKKKSGVAVSSLAINDFIQKDSTTDQTKGFILDSFAVRHLVMSVPASMDCLSSILITPERSLHRCRSVLETGEESVLTFDMKLQDTLTSQYRSSPRLSKQWRICSITGESCTEQPLPAPTPDAGPEAVVQAQLDALKRSDPATVFAFASPENQRVTGPLEHFTRLLKSPMFAPMLGHVKASTIQRWNVSSTRYLEAVVVEAAPVEEQFMDTGMKRPSRVIYMWEVGLQGPDSDKRNCWMTQSVQLLSTIDPYTAI